MPQARSEASCRTLIDRVPALIYELGPDGTIRFVNAGAKRITGYDRGELLGANAWDLFCPDDLRKQVEEVYARLRLEDVATYEMTLRVKDGTRKTLFWTSSNQYLPDGTLETISGFGVDISDRRREAEERERLRQEIEAQHEQFEIVVSNAPVVIAVVRGPDFVYEFVNPTAQAIAPGKAMLGRPFAEVWPERAPHQIPILKQVLRDGEPYHAADVPILLRRSPDGPLEETYFTYAYVPLGSWRGRAGSVLTIGMETTDQVRVRQRVQELARKAEANLSRLEAVVGSMSEGLITHDVQSDTTTANPAAQRFLAVRGAADGSMPRQEWEKLFQLSTLDGKPLPYEEWPLPRALRGEAFSNYQLQVRRVDSEETRIASYSGTAVRNEQGEIGLAVVTVRDMTHHRQVEEALRGALQEARGRREEALALLASLETSEERFRAVAETASDAIVLADSEGNIMFWNRAAEHIYGYASAEIVGRPLAVIVPARVSPLVVRHLGMRVGQPSAPRKVHELPGLRKDGSEFPAELSFARWNVRDGVFVTAIIRDVTERKRLEERLLRAQRLETAGRIAGQVAHDFNNLLAPLAGYPELIKMELPNGHEAVQLCDAMLEAVEQMAVINKDLMTMGRRGSYEQETTDLNHLVAQALTQMWHRPASLSVCLDLADELRSVSVSPAQMVRVISNLLFNAREAMQDRGTLTVRTRNALVDMPVGDYNRIEPGEYVCLTVSDTGCGIPAEIRDKIFDAFFTTKPAGERRGCGLGLSVVQAIVADHSGFVDFRSEPGEGTTFVVYLPIAESPRKIVHGEELPRGTESILVIDDDEVQREVAKRLLRSLGYQVAVASKGEEGLAYLREHPVDLLVLDMIMPGWNGVDTYRRVLDIRPGQKAIIISGFADSERVREAQALGAGALMSKPVTLRSLAFALRHELERRSGPGLSNPPEGAAGCCAPLDSSATVAVEE